ncbi:MAG: hypothetical protein AB7S26_36080 [Sandaracinaceae bacterium]
MPRTSLLGLLVLLALPACAIENPGHVRDTTGAEMGWECDTGSCRAVRESYSPLAPDCDGRTELLVGAGGLAILCAVPDGGDEPFEETCRPLACADLLDCPQWSARTYECIEGICQVESAAGFVLDRVDLAALCLYDVPRHASCAEAQADPIVMARMALVDAACASERCERPPADCLSP